MHRLHALHNYVSVRLLSMQQLKQLIEATADCRLPVLLMQGWHTNNNHCDSSRYCVPGCTWHQCGGRSLSQDPWQHLLLRHIRMAVSTGAMLHGRGSRRQAAPPSWAHRHATVSAHKLHMACLQGQLTVASLSHAECGACHASGSSRRQKKQKDADQPQGRLAP
jgi:hypothetical protein